MKTNMNSDMHKKRDLKYRIDLSAVKGEDVKCNLKCSYCHRDFFPVERNIVKKPSFKIVEIIDMLEEIYKEDKRVRKIHFSGRAEPLVADLHIIENELTAINKKYPVIEKVITSNGFLLSEKADMLAKCGIRKINVSVHDNSFKNKRYVNGIKSAVNSGMKVCLNVVVVREPAKRISEILDFASKHGLSVKFFGVLGLNKKENYAMIHHIDVILDSHSKSKYYDAEKDRINYRLKNGLQASLKLDPNESKRPAECISCRFRESCTEGCWESIRITPKYIKPCGLREDNVYYLYENNLEKLKAKLKSGGKIINKLN